MSLDFDLRGIANREELVEDGDLLPQYKNLILLMMAVGIGEINNRNVDEIFERIQILEAVDGPFLRGPNYEAVWYTREVVARMTGLKTNIHPKENKAKFLKKMGEGALRRLVRDFKRKQEEEARG